MNNYCKFYFHINQLEFLGTKGIPIYLMQQCHTQTAFVIVNINIQQKLKTLL